VDVAAVLVSKRIGPFYTYDKDWHVSDEGATTEIVLLEIVDIKKEEL